MEYGSFRILSKYDAWGSGVPIYGGLIPLTKFINAPVGLSNQELLWLIKSRLPGVRGQNFSGVYGTCILLRKEEWPFAEVPFISSHDLQGDKRLLPYKAS